MFKVKSNNPKWFMRKIEIKDSTIPGGGLGVFATEFIEKREIFESAPVILFHIDLLNDYLKLEGYKHILCDHVFVWEKRNHALCLGWGSIYNHSNDPNAIHRKVFDKEHPRIEFIAKKDIHPGEEIFHHYNPRSGDLFFTNSGSFDVDNMVSDSEKK